MLVADHIAKCLEKHHINDIFVFQGGSCARLIDSIAKNPKLHYFCNLHEQASSMSADAMSRLTGKLPAVLVTSGPGATNLVTGCAGAWYDSVPVLFLTGQVATQYLKEDRPIRQYGFQETDVLSMFAGITKYSARITKPNQVIYEIEKAIDIALSGRKGPVLLDIPEDIQRMEISESLFSHYVRTESQENVVLNEDIACLMKHIEKAIKPVFVVGQGVHCALAEGEMQECIERQKIPSVFTYGAMDILSSDHKYNFGNLGINGHACANAIVQDADLLIFWGTRLDHHVTGKNLELFAPQADKIIVDIDPGEIDKFIDSKLKFSLKIIADLKYVLMQMCKWKKRKQESEWLKTCWEAKFRLKNPMQKVPAHYFKVISDAAQEDAVIVFDTGSSLLWGMYYFQFKKGQRCISQFNHTAMGYALPAAIGAALAYPEKTVYCITGDGGLQLNIQELATIQKNQLNIKIIVFDNSAYALMLGAQNVHMDGRHAASTSEEGLPLPALEKIFAGYGIPCLLLDEKNVEDMVKPGIIEKGAEAFLLQISSDVLVENQVAPGRALSEEILS